MDIKLSEILNWINNNIFTVWHIIQFVIVFAISMISYVVSGFFRQNGLRDSIEKILKYLKFLSRENITLVVEKLIWPILAAILVWLYVLFAISFKLPYQILIAVGHLLNAWIIIKFISSLMHSKFIFRFIAFVIWIIAALKILKVYDQVITILNEITFSSGDYTVSMLTIIKGLIIFSILIFIADKISDLVESRINKVDSLTPSARVLIKKFVRIIMMIVVGLLGLNSLGLDLTAFAFLGGVLGVGLGFGLQKVVSNFVSGIIILADKSIKPGDVIEINDNYGYINSLDTRFVSLITRGGKEFLIPNEDFITQTVINWSYSDKMVRIDVPIGISYDSDLRNVLDLIHESLNNISRINNHPEPKCIVEGFGDSSIDLNIRFWISDPDQGVANIRSEVLLRLWDIFKENNIIIPYPQRDLHLRSIDKNDLEIVEKIVKEKEIEPGEDSEKKYEESNDESKKHHTSSEEYYNQ